MVAAVQQVTIPTDLLQQLREKKKKSKQEKERTKKITKIEILPGIQENRGQKKTQKEWRPPWQGLGRSSGAPGPDQKLKNKKKKKKTKNKRKYQKIKCAPTLSELITERLELQQASRLAPLRPRSLWSIPNHHSLLLERDSRRSRSQK